MMSEAMEWPNDMRALHTFRSRILGLVVVRDRLIATTERGVYRLDKNGKRWRKVLPSCPEVEPALLKDKS